MSCRGCNFDLCAKCHSDKRQQGEPAEEAEASPPPPTRSVSYTEPEAVCDTAHKLAHTRLQKLQELDKATKVPFILVELTGEGHGEGEIEICGKDEYGIYAALKEWLVTKWECEPMDPGDLTEDTKIPFCKAQYKWRGYAVSGEEGLNNMGLKTMELVDFVCGTLSWTLAIVNGGNVGENSEVREQQIIFKAPHPMNLVAPHMMIELRSAGYIEINADLDEADKEVLEKVDEFIMQRFEAEPIEGHEEFCNLYYKAGDNVFKGSAGSSNSNLGLLTLLMCDTVVTFPGWSLVAISSDNYGDDEHQEQQLVFRRDYHPLGDNCYLMATIRSSGIVEVTGKNQNGIQQSVGRHLLNKWKCDKTEGLKEGDTFCCRYLWQSSDVMTASASLTWFFEMSGWELQVCAQQMIRGELRALARSRSRIYSGSSSGSLSPSAAGDKKPPLVTEQQLLFRPGATEVGAVEPHLFIELYAGEGAEELYDDEETTQVLANQRIRLKPLAPKSGEGVAKTKEAVQHLHKFILSYLGGETVADEKGTYSVKVFMCRGRFENNLGQWTMRLCDFLVDRLGWSFLVCSLCNQGELGNYRAQQLVFRWDGDKRNVPVATLSFNNLDPSEWEDTEFPEHWVSPAVLERTEIHQVVKCTTEEKEALQKMVDGTFKRTLTRDRMPDDDAPEGEEMPYMLEIVDAFRSEHAFLHHRFEQRRTEVFDFPDVRSLAPIAETCLESRLKLGDAYLFHGTNPSSAMSILKNGFVLDHAGSSRGTMFGAGIYMAERSSKSDEYGRDDGGNTYPGLLALLVCRCFIGQEWVVTDSGDHVAEARLRGMDCVVGDRESKVGTYREYIFFDEAQLYPEFTVIYKRQYNKSKVPPHMVTRATGTTGRFWQISLERRVWNNLPSEVSKMLTQAKEDGEETMNVTLRGVEYTFDIQAKQGTNLATGNSVPLRAPMQ